MKKKFYFGIFFISAAALMLEVSLIRLFSVMQFYHFAFLVVSVALFGIAAAGTFMYIKKLKKPLLISSVLFSISTFFGFLLLNTLQFDPVRASVDYLHVTRLLAYYIFLGLPFFFFGIIIVYIFSKYQKESNKIYFYNLSGSALGSIAVLPLMGFLGEKIIFAVITIALISSAFFTKKKKTKTLAVIAIFSLLLFFAPIKLNISDYKELKQALNYPNAEHISTEWNSFSRVDIVKSSFTRYAPGLSSEYRTRLPEQIGILVDAASMNSITQDKNTDFVNHLPSSIGYQLTENPKTLIINAGAGLDVLSALKNTDDVTAAETNKLIVNAVKKYGEFSGNIYNKANIIIDNGRSVVKGDKKYDLIVISLAGNVLSSGFYGIAENYILTTEAFNDYYEHLTENGFLIVTRWLLYPPRESLRLFSLALEIDNQAEKTAMLRSWTTSTLVLGKNTFNEDTNKKIKDFSNENKFDIIYLPSEFEPNKYGKFKEPYYYQGIQNILKNKEKFYKDYLFDVSPVSDDKPFYFNFFKLSKFNELRRIMGESWQPFLDPGFLLFFLLIQAVVLSLIFILLPLKFLKEIRIKKPVVFFFLIGIAFMFVEIVLIQKFILLLGHTAYAVSTVIFSILLFSSLGSLLSQKMHKNKINFVLIILFFLIIIYSFLIPKITEFVITFSPITKIILSALIIAPLGFMMGIPFPTALRIINKKIIPWAWAVNGSASVLSTILATIISIFIGYSYVLWIAALLYPLGMVFLRN